MIARRLRLARTVLGTAAAEMAEYRVAILVWILTGTVPLIMMMIWMGLAEDGPMGGYSATDFAAYFLIVFLVRQMTAAWVYEELDREIRLGEMSPRLLFCSRPAIAKLWPSRSSIVVLVWRLDRAGMSKPEMRTALTKSSSLTDGARRRLMMPLASTVGMNVSSTPNGL